MYIIETVPIETVQMFCVSVSMLSLSSIVVYILYGHGDRRVLQSVQQDTKAKSLNTLLCLVNVLCKELSSLPPVQLCVHHKAGSCGIFLLRYFKT